ncbi:MAG: VOC family protein [Nanoarchaeota archaeon]|nr:VOC family protein [Nanoarchaeota archaeon]
MMQKIVPHLWFDKEAKEAAEFYTSLFPNSKVSNVTTLHNTPSGDCDIVSFDLASYSFMAISAGPLFKLNPSASFIVNFDPGKEKDAKKKIDVLWKSLADGGKVLMPLDKYPFSDYYGWVQDKFGVSWQILLSNPGGDPRPFITPSLMFVGKVCGRAEEAMNFYLSVFKNSEQGIIARYAEGHAPDKPGTLMFADVMLEDQWFAVMDSAHKHDFGFSEAVSFMVYCKDQAEIDYFWGKLSAVPKFEQCGWLKDKFGVSWQIVPVDLQKMMSSGTRDQIDRLTQAFLPMKKFDIAKLKKAFEGK